MAERVMFNTTDLVAPLHDRGITLSASQVHRLVTGTPEQLSLPVLAVLCDIFDTEPGVLIPTRAENAVLRKDATGDVPAASNLPTESRPRRVRLRPEE